MSFIFRLKISQCVALLGLVVSLAAGAAGAADRATVMAMQDEAGQIFSSHPYIIPNESKFAQFADGNRHRTGAFIGVGTFRVLAGASYGKFDEVIFADVDKRVVEFNRLQIEALKASPTIDLFLQSLMESHHEMREELKDPYGLTTLFDRKDVRSYMIEYVHQLKGMKANDKSASFLTNPAAYSHLRHLALTGHMHSVSASLLGTVTFKAVADLLKQEGMKVGVVDVSNAPDYFGGKASEWTSYLANLRALPWADDGLLNYTTEYNHNADGRHSGSWTYKSVGIGLYLKSAETLDRTVHHSYYGFNAHMQALSNERACSELFH